MQVPNRPTLFGEIIVLTGPQKGTTFPITKARVLVGRQAGNDIIFASETVSRTHAEIIWDNKAWCINKVSPRNSLWVNGKEVVQETLVNQDEVSFGTDIKVRFVSHIFAGNKAQLGDAVTVYRKHPQNQPPAFPMPIPAGVNSNAQTTTDEWRALAKPSTLIPIVLAAISAIAGIFTSADPASRATVFAFSFVGLALIMLVLFRTRKKPAPQPPVYQGMPPAIVAQNNIVYATQVRNHARRSFFSSVLINAILFVMLMVDLTFTAFTRDNASVLVVVGLTLIPLFIGLLTTFILFTIKIPTAIKTHVINGQAWLWITGIVFCISILSLILDLPLVSVANPTAFGLALFYISGFLLAASVVVFIVALVAVRSMKRAYVQQPSV